MKKVIITGATGFVGSRLATYLLKEDFEVALIVRPTSSYQEIEFIVDDCKLYVYDYDINSLINALGNYEPDVVIHCASLFLSNHSFNDVDNLIDSNVKFPSLLLETMDRLNIKSFINTGTAWQHYNSEEYNPVNLYAATKQAFEDVITYYVEAKGFKAITLKLFDTYGPSDPRGKLISLLDNYANNQKQLDLSPGEQVINLVHIDDVVNAYIKAIENLNVMNYGHEKYGVASRRVYTLRELIKEYESIKNVKLNVNWGGKEYREREVMKCWDEFKTISGWNCSSELRFDDGFKS